MEASDRAWAKPVLLLLAIAGGLWLLFAIGPLLRVFVVAGLLAYLLNPVVDRLESRNISRTSATAAVFLAVVLVAAAALSILFPMLIEDALAAQRNLAGGQAGDNLQAVADLVERPLIALGMRDLDLFDRARTYLVEVGEGLMGFLLDAVSLVATMIIIPFLSFFLVRDSREIKRALVAIVPNRFFELSLNLIHKMDLQMGSYLRGQLIESAIVGMLSATALGVLGLESFLVLGAFAGLANLVPYVGPLVGAVPAVLVALMQFSDPAVAGYVALSLFAVQMIDNGILKPVVVGKSVNLSPLTIIVAVLIGGQLFGVLGMILSIPVTGFLRVAARETRIVLHKYRFS